MSNTEVLCKAISVVSTTDKSVDSAEKTPFYKQELSTDIRASYDDILKKILPPYKEGDSAASIVFLYYDQFNAQLIKVLTERADNGDSDAQSVLTALSDEQSKRLAAATEAVKEVISMGDPMRMEGALVKLAKEGKIDESFLLLLEANANQGKAAGAIEAYNLMKRLGTRALEEKDKSSSSKEIKLLRQLLCTDDIAERKALVVDAFTPKQGLLVSI